VKNIFKIFISFILILFSLGLASAGTVEVSTPFPIDAWHLGVPIPPNWNGWDSCSSMSGGIAFADNFCKCNGYDGVNNSGADACYKRWAPGRFTATNDVAPTCAAKVSVTNAGLATGKILCFILDWNITITSPAGGSVMGPSAFFNATTDVDASCEYKIDSGSYALMDITGNLDHSQLLTGLADGSHTAYINCTDNQGHWKEKSVDWTVDASGPTIVLVAPTSTAMTSGTPIVFEITDISGVDQTWYSINGSADTPLPNIGGSNYAINTTGWLEGSYSLIVYANDTRGNLADSTSILTVPIIIDDTAPSLTINSPVAGWYGNWLMLNVTAIDNFEVDGVKCGWSLGNQDLIFDGVYWLSNLSTVSLAEGNYNFTCTAVDNAGNDASQNVTDVLIDHTGPTVTILTPINMTALTMGSSFNVVASATDTGSGMIDGSNCPVYINNNWAGQITYSAATGNCEGTVTAVKFKTATVAELIVFAYDVVGNEGNSSATGSIYVNLTRAPTGGGGGGGVPTTTNETPEELLISVDAEPNSIDMFSNESAKITVTIENIGKSALQSLYLSVSGLDADEWTAEPDGRINIEPGNKTTIIVTITPKAHNDGDYTVNFTIGNARAEKSDNVDLTITNVEQLSTAAKARASCDNARALITNLSATGANTAGLQTNLTIAEDAINDGDFSTALGICDSISATATGAGAGGITGLVIGVGSFVAGNWVWMLVTAGLGLGAFVGRRQLLTGFGKLGGGAVSLLKSRPKLPKLFSRKKTELNTGGNKDDNPEFEIGY